MEPDSRQPGARLRLIDVRVSSDRANLHLGGRLAGVLTEPPSRREAARLIAATIVGPRPDEADGSIEVDGQLVSVRTLPSPMLAPGAPALVDRSVLADRVQAWCARRRDELAIEHASLRLERHRIEAALERARDRPPAPPPSVAPPSVEAPVDNAPAAGDGAPDPARAHVEALLEALDALESRPLPEGALLADAWAAHLTLVRVREAVDAEPAEGIEALEDRVNAARRAVAAASSTLSDAARQQIEQCHREVVDAQASIVEARRRQRSKAVARYEQAVTAELIALADAGLDSYASFELAVAASDSGADARELAAAQAELAAARAALDDARQVPDVPTRLELEERELLMRTRASELLGHPPGPDAEAELRALRVPPEYPPEQVEALAAALREGGVPVTDDVVGCAHAFLAAAESSKRSAPASEAPSPAAEAPTPVGAASAPDVDALEEQRRAHERALDDIEQELARLDAVAAVDVARPGAQDLASALGVVLDEYRAGDLLNGTLPLVIDGVLDDLPADARETAVRLLAAADDVQAVVVTDDPEVMQSLAYAGAAITRWPEAVRS